MKISYNWLKDFVQTAKTPSQLSDILTNIGLEVEALEMVQRIPGGLEGLVIGEVKTCEQHPNADRLRVTTVDVKGEVPLHIVCGAPNVAVGQRVVVATVGTTVHPIAGEPFMINKSKIRGEVSEGMICAEDEIGLGSSHEGIMVLPDDAPIGMAAKAYFDIQDDYVFEIGLTPNRADAASHLGVARDIAAFLRSEYRLPAITAFVEDNSTEALPVEVEDKDACPRYSSVSIHGVRVGESPEWLKERLQAIGVRPINNVVDVTNYVLHELGQPLHAFDASRLSGNKVVVRHAKAGESFVTLDGVTRTLHAEDLMICDADKPLCIAGVFGGIHSGVTENTTNIFLESAYFNAVSVRKTSKRHGLKTDASFRFERGTDPDITVLALKRAALLITAVAGGRISGPVSDVYPSPIPPFVFEVRYTQVQRLIGKAIPEVEIKAIIEALGITVLHEAGGVIRVQVPPYKVDVTREVDIIEEVLRIYGYNNIEIKRQIKASLNTSPKPDKEVVQNQVADLLIGNGYREILSNSLTKMDYMDDPASAVRLLNPRSADLDTLRQNLLFSALEAISYNEKRKLHDLKLFEFGHTYHTAGDGFVESPHLALAITGKQWPEQWNHIAKPVSFYDMKASVDGILRRLNITGLHVVDTQDTHYQYGLAYERAGKTLVSFGAVSPAYLQKADVNAAVFYADFNWELILKAIRKNKITYQEVSKFPAVRRDLSLLLDDGVTFETLKGIAEKTERKLLKSVRIFDVYKGDKLPAGKKSYALYFILQDEEKTLNDKQIDTIVKKLIYNFEKETGAEVRK
ncbi:phenylalanine--tRNA ligase subunit beta [Parapedobacter koreensis]|uniref:Phenylalanine--tRNA ligase beta subunit n=1 Tax=Parapedobacter koreensis TaxID=332977 RepID=A0A1H7TII4_9SPHI|nr:phenylalanine--tRNA ligase subunit beta [Parapedobacter koreensis]SEL84640.1 phenylalanyl-tRNA synthetase beta subunit [Parapedobacter koreensis]